MVLAGGCAGDETGPARARSELPAKVVWAWERPEDLRALDVEQLGVAVLAATITLSAEDVEVQPRAQPVRLPAGARVMPVVRIEVDRHAPPVLDERQRALVVAEVAELAHAARGAGLQIDFEATASQRPFYRSLLGDLRAQLGPRVPLSMTALASWCLGDRWLAGLPVDEVVPMDYRLGPRRAEAEEVLARRGDFPAPECRSAIGLSLDAPARLPAGWPPSPRRAFLFNPRSWTPADLDMVTRDMVTRALTPAPDRLRAPPERR